MFTGTQRKQRRAFSLVEALLATVIVAILVVAALGTFGAIAKSRFIRAERQQAFALASQFMAEILQARFASGSNNAGQDGGETPGNTRQFDDVDDYNGFSSLVLRNRDGNKLTGLDDWRVSTTVTYVDPLDPAVASVSATSLKRIAVTVRSPRGASVTVYGLRSSGGLYEQSPISDTTLVTWAGLQMKVGANGSTLHAAAHPINLSSSQP